MTYTTTEKKPTLQHNITNNNTLTCQVIGIKKKPVTGQKKPTMGYIIFSVYV
jgi:hypothetical protein